MWTVDREHEERIQHMDLNRSGGSFLANLTLRLAPNLENDGVWFESGVNDENAIPYIPYVEKGVCSFVAKRADAGKPVGYLRVTLIAITIHPVDAKSWRFAEAAEMAMSRTFDEIGVEL